MRGLVLILLTTLLHINTAVAQLFPQQDCFGSLPVCENRTPTLFSSTGPGEYLELDNNSYCFIATQESYSTWYVFTTSTAGDMEFDIIPNGPDDYDFMLFDITNYSCQDIVDGNLPPVRCNFAGVVTANNTYVTGLRAGYPDTFAVVNGDSFLAPVPVQANQTFALLVNNFLPTGRGYELDFTGGTADVVDNVQPTIIATDTLTCDTTTTFEVTFSEPIACDSILPDGSQFTITGPSPPNVVGAYSTECLLGDFTSSITLIFDAPILEDGHSVTTQAGTGGTYLTDLCQNPVDSTQNFPFWAPAIILPDFGYTISASCVADTFIFVNTSAPSTTNGNPTWDWNFGDGSTNSNLQDPAHTFPAEQPYTVTLTATTDDGCTYSGDSLVEVQSSYFADFTWSMPACPTDSVYFMNTSPGASDTWYWQISNGTGVQFRTTENPAFLFPLPGTYSVTFEISSNNPPTICPPTSVVKEVVVGEAVAAYFTVNQAQFCVAEPISFSDSSTGSPTSWSWDFGNGNTSDQQNATTAYIDTGFYDVVFVATNGCNSDTVLQTVYVNAIPVFDLGEDTSVCFTEPVTLYALPGASSYQWSTGQTSDSIVVTQVPADIRATVSNNGCIYEDQVNLFETTDGCVIAPIPSAFSPNGDGLNDYFRLISPDRISSLEIWIYNRWGQLVFHDTNIDFEWDGVFKREKADMGVYTYVLEGRGYSSNGLRPFYRTGNLTLLR